MEKKELLAYIEHVYKLESSLYVQRRLMGKIRGGIEQYKNVRYKNERPYLSGESDYYIANGLKTLGGCAILFGIPIWFFLALMEVLEFSFAMLCGTVFIIGLPGIILFMWNISSKERKVDEENKKIKKLNEQIREENKILQEHNAKKFRIYTLNCKDVRKYMIEREKLWRNFIAKMLFI